MPDSTTSSRRRLATPDAARRPRQDQRPRVNVFYGEKQALFDVSLDMPDKSVTALIGPSGCGKSTFLRCMNRMNDTIPGCKVTGRSRSTARTSTTRAVDPVLLRARVGMVFQKPNPFPKTHLRERRLWPAHPRPGQGKAELEHIVEASLKRAGLWDEVADRLHQPGTGLSGGQQQRLVIARAIAVEPRSDPDGRALLGARPDRHRARSRS